MTKLASILGGLLFLVPAAFGQTTGQISGTVTDEATQEPLVGVKIVIVEATLETTTGKDGSYKLISVPPGQYEIKTSRIGYESVSLSATVSPNEDTKLNISLRESIVSMPTVVVSAEKLAERTSVSDMALTKRMLLSRHGLMEDPIRVIHTMPGVMTQGDLFSASQIYIRGGAPEENLFLLDWVRVYWPWYFGGIKSVYNTDIVETAELLTGGFPAKYGNALSSVLSITTREGNRERISGDFSFGFINTQGRIEGPFTSKASYLVTGRRSYLDLILKESTEFPVPSFADFNFKFSYEPAAGHHIDVNGFLSKENVDFITDDPAPGLPDRTVTNGNLNTQSLEWKALFNANLYSKLSLLRAQPTYSVEVGRNFNFQIDGATVGVREDLTWNLHPNHELKTGFELTQTIFKTSGNLPLDPSEIDPTDISVQSTFYDFSEGTWSGGGYLQNSWELLPALTLTGGGRFDYLSLNEKIDLSPRFSVHYELDSKTTLRGAWGHYYQFPNLQDIDREPGLQSPLAIHYIVGISREFNNAFHGWVEVYQKDYQNLVAVNTLEDYSNHGQGFARGIEFFLQKKTGSLVGWLSYALSVAKRREYLDTQVYDFDFDQRHLLSLTLSYNFPKPNKSKWYMPAVIALTSRYASGRPYTPIVSAEKNLNGGWVPVRGETNSRRFSPFHNLNLRVEWQFALIRKLQGTSFIEIWNLSNRRNVLGFSYQYSEEYLNNVNAQPYHTTPFLLAGGFSIRF